MAEYFDISQLSGTGPTTITLKPKAINDTESMQQQVLKVRAGDVEKTITLIQEPKKETLGSPVFKVNKTSLSFDGTKTGESLEIEVSSYLEKFLNGKPTGELVPVSFTFEASVDWVNIETIEDKGTSVILKVTTSSMNNEYDLVSYDPVVRSGVIGFTQDGKPTSGEVTLTQSKGKVRFEFRAPGNMQALHSGLASSESYSKDLDIRFEILKLINNKSAHTYQAYCKIPTLANRWSFSGKVGGDGGLGGGLLPERDYSAEGWVTNSNVITSSFVNQATLSCNGKYKSQLFLDEMSQKIIGVYPNWPLIIDTSRLPNGCTLSNLEDFKNPIFGFTI